MKTVPNSPSLFWTSYAVGTFGPFAISYLFHEFMPHSDSAFLYMLFGWLAGACVLICCVWSVRAILVGGSERSHRPAWLYRTIGWIALAESIYWATAFVRVI